MAFVWVIQKIETRDSDGAFALKKLEPKNENLSMASVCRIVLGIGCLPAKCDKTGIEKLDKPTGTDG